MVGSEIRGYLSHMIWRSLSICILFASYSLTSLYLSDCPCGGSLKVCFIRGVLIHSLISVWFLINLGMDKTTHCEKKWPLVKPEYFACMTSQLLLSSVDDICSLAPHPCGVALHASSCFLLFLPKQDSLIQRLHSHLQTFADLRYCTILGSRSWYSPRDVKRYLMMKCFRNLWLKQWLNSSLWLNSLHSALAMDIDIIWWYTEEENPILLVRHMNSSLNSKRCIPVVLSFTSFIHPCYLSNNPSVTRDHAVVIGVVKVSSSSMKLWKGHSCSGIFSTIVLSSCLWNSIYCWIVRDLQCCETPLGL